MLKQFLLLLALVSVCVYGTTNEWTAMETEGLVGTPAAWRRVKRAPAHIPLRLTFALTRRNPDELESLFWRVSDPRDSLYGKHLSLEQIGERFGPRVSDVEVVHEWLSASDVYEVTTTVTGDYVSVKMTSETAERLLNTEFHVYEHTLSGRALVRALDGQYSLPSRVADVVDFVGGVRHFARVFGKSPAAKNERAVEDRRWSLVVDPKFIREKYDIEDVNGGAAANNSQAVVQFLGESMSRFDLDEFMLLFSDRTLGEQPTIMGTNEFLPGTEASLDIQYIMSIGSHVNTTFWGNPNTDSFNEEPFLLWLEDMANMTEVPYVVSVSYGDEEDAVTATYARRVDQDFQLQGLRGISIIFASGDSGVGGIYSGNYYTGACEGLSPDYPASSIYVTSVGATTMTDFFETGNMTTSYLSGGGFSNYFPRPSYQETAVDAYLNSGASMPDQSLWNATGRAYPDLSAFGEGYVIVMDLIPLPGVDGTSCATPVTAGIVSLLNDVRLENDMSTLGFLNPFLYGAFAARPDAFFDVTTGSNPGCGTEGFEAAEGFDPATGLGTLNYKVLEDLVLYGY